MVLADESQINQIENTIIIRLNREDEYNRLKKIEHVTLQNNDSN